MDRTAWVVIATAIATGSVCDASSDELGVMVAGNCDGRVDDGDGDDDGMTYLRLKMEGPGTFVL